MSVGLQMSGKYKRTVPMIIISRISVFSGNSMGGSVRGERG